MGEIASALRYQMPCDKEWKTTALQVTDVVTQFQSSLTGGYSRKRLSVYNMTNAASGECYYGPANTLTAANGMILEKGTKTEIPLASGEDTNTFFISDPNCTSNLRIFECS